MRLLVKLIYYQNTNDSFNGNETQLSHNERYLRSANSSYCQGYIALIVRHYTISQKNMNENVSKFHCDRNAIILINHCVIFLMKFYVRLSQAHKQLLSA